MRVKRCARRGETVKDEPTRPCCFSRYVRIAARTTFAVVNNLYCIPAYVVWMMALRIVKPISKSLYWKLEGLMYHWLLAMVSMWSWTAGYEIIETGDEPAACAGRRVLVLANHQSTADVPMLMAAWNPRPGVLPNLMWIMDRIFKFTNFGIVSVLHEDFFIQAFNPVRSAHVVPSSKASVSAEAHCAAAARAQSPASTRLPHGDPAVAAGALRVTADDLLRCVKGMKRGQGEKETSLEELRQHIHKFYIPLARQFIVLFPEGGFLHKRREISQRFAEKNNLPKLEYVSLPRAGAMKVIMEEIGPSKDHGASSSKEEASKKDSREDKGKPQFYVVKPSYLDPDENTLLVHRNENQEIPATQSNKENSISESSSLTSIHAKVGDNIEWILDVTIAYPDRIPLHLVDVVCGTRPPCTTNLHYRLYPSTEVPSDTEGMTQWLYDRFIEKDKMLQEFYITGKFPPQGNSPNVTRQVRQDNLRYLILHLFFIMSTYLQYLIFTAFIRVLI